MGTPQETPKDRRLRSKIAVAFTAGAIVGASVPGGILISDISTPVSTYEPGGEWIQPLQPISDNSGVVHFRMEAYPTAPNTTPVQDVFVTDAYADQTSHPWSIACRAVPLPKGQYPNEWGCDWKPPKEGDIFVAFTVVDKAGRENSAPQGIHQINERKG